MTMIKVSKSDKFVKQILTATFPKYKGRKVRIEAQRFPLDVRSYWDGGSRDYFVFLNLADMKSVSMPGQGINDRPVAGADKVTLPEGVACVEHSIFCGKDVGITIHVNPNNLTQLLTAGSTESEAR